MAEEDSSASARPDSEESPRADPSPGAAPEAKGGAEDVAPPASAEGCSASQAGIPPSQPILTIPIVALPCIVALDTAAFTGQFARTHQAVLATVAAQPHVQMQSAYDPSETPTSTPSQPVLPTAKSVPSQPMSPGTETNSGDVFNWRKYGQKQVKNTENSRSYYRCANSNCLAKKKVERSPDGKICEVIYSGKHDHDPPQKCRYTRERGHQLAGPSIENESSDHQSNLPKESDPSACKSEHNSGNAISEQQLLCSSDHEGDVGIKSERDVVEEPDPKRRLSENTKSTTTTREEISKSSTPSIEERPKSSRTPIDDSSKSSKTVREYVQTETNARNLSDGYRWRKYGQKFVKGNPNPRSYYRCTHEGCPVRKHVERSSHDAKALLITYEGKHNHDQPTPKNASDQQLPTESPASGTSKETTAVGPSSDKDLPKDSNLNDPVANLADDKASEVRGNEPAGCAQTLTGIKESSDRTNPDGMRNPLLNENPAAVPVENS